MAGTDQTESLKFDDTESLKFDDDVLIDVLIKHLVLKGLKDLKNSELNWFEKIKEENQIRNSQVFLKFLFNDPECLKRVKGFLGVTEGNRDEKSRP